MPDPPQRHPLRLFQWWTRAMQRHALAVLLISLVSTGLVLYWSVRNLSLDTDLSHMISDRLPFRADETDFRRGLPKLSDTIVVVVDADTPEGASAARTLLAEGLRRKKNLFTSVYEPGGGSFFEKNGLLYLSTEELQDLSDNLASVQPLLALLVEDFSLPNLFSVVGMAVEKKEEAEIPVQRLNLLFERMSDGFDTVLRGLPRRVSWQEILAAESASLEKRRRFIIVQPRVDPFMLAGAQAPLDAVRSAAAEAGLDEARGVRVRLTGDVPLSNENLVAIRGTLGIALAASFLLVAATLALGVRGSLLFTAANLLTLLVGLVWTLAFAVAAVGKLNLISVTFGVLYIGVGLDFGLLYCLVYREYLARLGNSPEAITATSLNVGKGLFLCMAAESIGFFAFVPTAYAGASDLGLISGVGMFVNLAVNLTLLPALLTLFPAGEEKVRNEGLFAPKLAAFPYAHAKGITAAAAVAALGAAALLPRLTFDYNPLDLYNPGAEAVATARELFADPETSPWTASVLVRDRAEAQRMAERLKRLREVESTLALPHFVPKEQEEKLAIIGDMAFFMPLLPAGMQVRKRSAQETMQALADLQGKLQRHFPPGAGNPHAEKLCERIRQFRERETADGGAGVAMLEEVLLSNLPLLLRRMEVSLQATEVRMEDLPPELLDQYRTLDGRYRVQIFPRENITDFPALQRFVGAVRTVAPHATDSAVSIYESGKAVVASFRQATFYALAAVAAYLLLELRSVLAVVLIFTPFGLALLLTTAASVLLQVPLNFANIIVLPLILGLAIDNDIHFIFRYRRDPSGDPNMLRTSTSRAVFFNTLTSIVGFSTLCFIPHRGLSSMGIILTLCMIFVFICTALVMPALMEVCKGRLRSDYG